MPFRIYRKCARVCCIAALAGTSCRQQMADQPRYDPYQESTFFADSLSARPLPEGVVSRTSMDLPAAPAMTLDVLDRGRQRFDIYCSPCHGYTGAGDGIVSIRGLRRPPPSFHSDRLRTESREHFYDVIRHGFGAMPSYSYQVSEGDGWAIASYIRALQRSQWAGLNDVPAEELRQLQSEPQ